MGNIPEGAQDKVEKLVGAIAVSINSWVDSTTDGSEAFKKGVVMNALTNSLIMWAMLYEVPAEAVIKSVINTLHANGAFGDDEDDEVVH